jgi:hypothetical protein
LPSSNPTCAGVRTASRSDARMATRSACKCRFNFPQKCRSKIPHFGGHGDQPTM